LPESLYGCCTKNLKGMQALYVNCVLPAKRFIFKVEPRGFEPLTSAVQRRHYPLLKLSGACKIAANTHIFCAMPFPSFQEIYSGCCTLEHWGHVGIYSGNGYIVHGSGYYGKVVESKMRYIKGF
jgi:hypothetical protein